jgi:hypothetical protein
MIHTHVACKSVPGVVSPLNLLNAMSDEDVHAAVFATRQAFLH